MLRIACDLDGTLADMDAALRRESDRLFGAPPDGAPPSPPDGSETPSDDTAPVPLDDERWRALWAHVAGLENFWASLDEIEPGSVARFATLARAHHWEVIFLTQRSGTAGEIAQRQSQRWLCAHGFEYPSVFVMNGSRGRVAEALALDVVIDDRAGNCLDVVADSSATPVLIWRPSRGPQPPGLDRNGTLVLDSVAAALDVLEQRTRDRARPRTLVGRLRDAIGLG